MTNTKELLKPHYGLKLRGIDQLVMTLPISTEPKLDIASHSTVKISVDHPSYAMCARPTANDAHTAVKDGRQYPADGFLETMKRFSFESFITNK
jgi:hypothetical protein